MGYGKGKRGGFTGNMAKLGGSRKKLKLTGDMRAENMVHPALKRGSKQAHKKV